MKKYEQPAISIEVLATADLLQTSNADVEKDADQLEF